MDIEAIVKKYYEEWQTVPEASIQDQMRAALTELAAGYDEQLEVERMRLAACGVIAMSNTAESAAKARQMLPEYWSASAKDCANAVDREMALRERIRQIEAERVAERVKDGWQLVPKEMNAEMRVHLRALTTNEGEVWQALLAAAPQQQKEGE